jgi:hypothetical protein
MPKETIVARLSLEDAMKLLGVQAIPGKPWQAARFRKWIERVVESRGESFVSANRRDLLNQWEEFAKGKFKNCV